MSIDRIVLAVAGALVLILRKAGVRSGAAF
jgi:hypothetical protein